MDKVPTTPGEKHVTRAEVSEIIRPLTGAIIQLTSAVIDLAEMAKNMEENPAAVEKGESAYKLIGEVIDQAAAKTECNT